MVCHYNGDHGTQWGGRDPGTIDDHEPGPVDPTVPPALRRMHRFGRVEYDALLRLVADGPDGVLGGLPLALVCAAGSLCARRETFSQFYSAARFSLARAVRTA